jgi:hypothetical protein
MLEDGMQEVVGDSMPELLLPDRDLMSPYSDFVVMVVVVEAPPPPLWRWRWWCGGENVPEEEDNWWWWWGWWWRWWLPPPVVEEMGEEEEELSISEESRHTEAEMCGWGGATSAILPGLPIIGDVTMKRAPAPANSETVFSPCDQICSSVEYHGCELKLLDFVHMCKRETQKRLVLLCL